MIKSNPSFFKPLLVTFIISVALFFQLRSLAHLKSGPVRTANEVLRDTLNRFRTFYFEDYRPISQLLLREPLSPFISFIQRDHSEILGQLRDFQAEFENIKAVYYQNFSAIERTVVSDTADSISYLVKDHDLGWNLLSTSTFDLWQEIVNSDNLVQMMGPERTKRALSGLFLQTPLWHSEQMDRWRQAISDGWVMPQGGVERFIKSLKKNTFKEEAYLAMIKSSSAEITDIDTHLIVQNLMESSRSLLTFLENEYLEAAKKFRPYSNPGLDALGEKGLALYDHMIERRGINQNFISSNYL